MGRLLAGATAIFAVLRPRAEFDHAQSTGNGWFQGIMMEHFAKLAKVYRLSADFVMLAYGLGPMRRPRIT